jgi:hypothetical protein
VVLQYARPDGFVPPEYRRVWVPLLTLYGDGTAIFLSFKDDALNGRLHFVRLTEAQVQDLLRYAVEDARFFSAKERYPDHCGCDNFWTSITVRTADKVLTASAYALVTQNQPPSDWPQEDIDQWGRLVALRDRLESTASSLDADVNSRRYVSGGVILHVQRPYNQEPDRAEVLPWPIPEVALETAAPAAGSSRAAALEGTAAYAVQMQLPLHASRYYRDRGVVYGIDYRPRLPSDWTWGAAPPPHVGSISPVPHAEALASLMPDGLCVGFRFRRPTSLGDDPAARVSLTLDGADVTRELQWVISLDASLGNTCYSPTEPLAAGGHTAALSYSDGAGNAHQYAWSFSVKRQEPPPGE